MTFRNVSAKVKITPCPYLFHVKSVYLVRTHQNKHPLMSLKTAPTSNSKLLITSVLAVTPYCPQHWAFIAHQWGNKYPVTIQISPDTEVNNCVFLLWRDSQCHCKFPAKSSVLSLTDSLDILIVCGFIVMQTESCQLSVEVDQIPSSVPDWVQYLLCPIIPECWTRAWWWICCFRALPVRRITLPRIKIQQENGKLKEKMSKELLLNVLLRIILLKWNN